MEPAFSMLRKDLADSCYLYSTDKGSRVYYCQVDALVLNGTGVDRRFLIRGRLFKPQEKDGLIKCWSFILTTEQSLFWIGEWGRFKAVVMMIEDKVDKVFCLNKWIKKLL